MKGFHYACGLLPRDLEQAALSLPEEEKRRCEELRLRVGRPCTALLDGREYVLSRRAVTAEDIRTVAERASGASLHARTEQLRRGFLAAPGGVRVGLCGEAVLGPAGLEGFSSFSSAAIRVPRAVLGCADGIWEELTGGGFSSTLLLSPPGAGKTTLLRELIRRLSGAGYRVAAADERWEISGCAPGERGFDLGPHTDSMSGVPKAQAVGMMLRAMNPQIIAVDEITDPADTEALLHAVGCGVKLLATAHGAGAEDIARRPAGRLLMEQGVFRRCVLVENRDGHRRYRVEELPCG